MFCVLCAGDPLVHPHPPTVLRRSRSTLLFIRNELQDLIYPLEANSQVGVHNQTDIRLVVVVLLILTQPRSNERYPPHLKSLVKKGIRFIPIYLVGVDQKSASGNLKSSTVRGSLTPFIHASSV